MLPYEPPVQGRCSDSALWKGLRRLWSSLGSRRGEELVVRAIHSPRPPHYFHIYEFLFWNLASLLIMASDRVLQDQYLLILGR